MIVEDDINRSTDIKTIALLKDLLETILLINY
jgi:hypothetical protein